MYRMGKQIFLNDLYDRSLLPITFKWPYDSLKFRVDLGTFITIFAPGSRNILHGPTNTVQRRCVVVYCSITNMFHMFFDMLLSSRSVFEFRSAPHRVTRETHRKPCSFSKPTRLHEISRRPNEHQTARWSCFYATTAIRSDVGTRLPWRLTRTSLFTALHFSRGTEGRILRPEHFSLETGGKDVSFRGRHSSPGRRFTVHVYICLAFFLPRRLLSPRLLECSTRRRLVPVVILWL